MSVAHAHEDFHRQNRQNAPPPQSPVAPSAPRVGSFAPRALRTNASSSAKVLAPPPTIQPGPDAPVTTITASDIRALITRMREQGQLAPPPVVDYARTIYSARQRRPNDINAHNSLVPSRSQDKGKMRAQPFDDRRHSRRSSSRDAADAKRKLNESPGSDDDAGAERGGGQTLSTEDEDEHNIDDMYGSVPPQHLDAAPQHVELAVTARLLWMNHERRSADDVMDDLGLILEKKARIEAQRDMEEGFQPRRPRKSGAHRLVGKRLKHKQDAALIFCRM